MFGKQWKIAISGKARAGKNTIASLLVEHMNLDDTNSKIIALADPMKRIAKAIFPEARDECLFGPSELRSQIISNKYVDKMGNPLTHRQFLIDLGAFARLYNDNVWLHLLVEDARTSKDKLAYIVSDVRFINEFKFLKDSGFYMIRILRDESTNIDDISEIEQDSIPNSDFDRIIHNNYSLESLSLEVKCCAKALKQQ
jgi:hypothetical protein